MINELRAKAARVNNMFMVSNVDDGCSLGNGEEVTHTLSSLKGAVLVEEEKDRLTAWQLGMSL